MPTLIIKELLSNTNDNKPVFGSVIGYLTLKQHKGEVANHKHNLS